MSTQKQAFQLLTLPEIFLDRFFKIPDYQRGYSWEKQPQLEDLRKDIENLYERDYKHFTGTIVAAQRPDGIFEIVDGQQRLTSLIILLAEIYNSAPETFPEIYSLYIQRGSLGNESAVLETNDETRHFFQELVINRKQPVPEIKSHTCIIEAQKYFREWINEKKTDKKQIVEAITSKLGFILFSPQTTSEIGIMFEVINNRGKDLSELEKIKNYLIYFSTVFNRKTLHDRINRQWGILQKNLSLAKVNSNDDENKFLRYCFLVFTEVSKTKSYYVYRELKERFPVNSSKVILDEAIRFMSDFVDFITQASRNYVYYFRPGDFKGSQHQDINGRIDKALKYLRCQHVNASIMPVYLAVMNSFYRPMPEGMSELERTGRVADLLELLEKVNMRVYILPGITNRADSHQGVLFTLAHEFYRDSDWILQSDEEIDPTKFGQKKHPVGSNIYDWLELELRQLTLTVSPERRIIETLTISTNPGIDFYQHWHSGMRYFLACYEEDLRRSIKKRFEIENILITREDAKDASNEYLSLEHLWARENRSDDFPGDNIVKRRLGNFVLMGLSSNISQYNYDLEDKVMKLVEVSESVEGSLDLKQVRDLPLELHAAMSTEQMQGWQKKRKNFYLDQATALCDHREEKMIRFALKRWALPKEKMKLFEGLDSFRARSEKQEYYHYFKDGSQVDEEN